MNDMHVMLLRDQIARDSVWCGFCGIGAGERRSLADVKYTAASDDGELTASAHACRIHFDQARLDGINIVSSEPVSQPAYIALLQAALDDLAGGQMSMQDRVNDTYRTAIEQAVSDASHTLKQFPRGPSGLVSDAVRLSPEYKAAKRRHADAFARLRNFNGGLTQRAR